MSIPKNEELFAQGFTHGGIFHADDVFATAFLRILNPNIKILRGSTIPDDFTGIVYDIGLGKFDHHQKDRRVRTNGVPYAAFGLLWEEFGMRLLCEEDAGKFDIDFIQSLDLADNTGEKNILSQIISDKNPTWQDDIRREEAFEKAVFLAKDILESRFYQIRAERDAFETVSKKAASCRDGILYLERAMPWKDAVKAKEIFYVIYPSMRGGYNIQAVPTQYDDMQLKRPFPESWRGADAETLANMTGIRELMFCHNSGFLCAANTLEGAYQAARLAMKN